MTQGASIDRDMIDAADQALDRVALVAAAIPALCTEDIEGACCGASCVLLDALEELRASVRAVDGGPEE